MPAQRIEAGLEAVLAHTREMLAVARSGDWVRLAALQDAHSTSLATLLSLSKTGLDSHHAMVRLRQIEEANRELMGLVRGRRDRLARELHGYGAGRRAVHAYRQCEPGG